MNQLPQWWINHQKEHYHQSHNGKGLQLHHFSVDQENHSVKVVLIDLIAIYPNSGSQLTQYDAGKISIKDQSPMRIVK